ncbi:hypothetical protein QYE76_045407 [Lolium multiflorum]|uniref:CCHC-type domain-containing protein n=1 Tax=Lolium multiflorum TaxID=4521 RepID=A0AAD8WY23_LOLMU|nr:hypothetical protein QYE76_045407 [Lolium multiflorum]
MASHSGSGASSSGGRLRWLDSDGETSSARTYRDVAASPPPAAAPAPAASPRAAPASRSSARGRIPASARIGPRSEIHRAGGAAAVDAEGFQRPRRRYRQRRASPRPAPNPHRRRSNSPPGDDLCFRCLEAGHRVRDCTNKVRCRVCLILGHSSDDRETCRRERDLRQRRLDADNARSRHTGQARTRSPPAPAPAAPQPRPAPPAAQPPTPPSAPLPPPPGQSSSTPVLSSVAPVRVLLSRTVEMEEAELTLRRAMVATITGTRPAVSALDLERTLYSMFDLAPGDFSVHLHHPEDFLILFSTRATMDRLAGEHLINATGFSFLLRPWNKVAHAGQGRLDQRVELELRGIPAQAWHVSTAEHILGSGCWIERLHPDTRSRVDMAVFRASARTDDPSSIRRRAVLEIVELLPPRIPSAPPTLRTLTYQIDIHVVPSDGDHRAAARAPQDGDRDRDDAGARASDNEQHAGNSRPRRRGRKRRRTGGAPDGRADGMAVDSTGWTEPRLSRADGVAIDASWGRSRAAAPPAQERTMGPWPGRRGARRRRRRARKGKAKESRKKQTAKVWRAKAIPAQATTASPLAAPTAVAARVAGNDLEVSNVSSPCACQDSSTGADPAATNEMVDRDQSLSPTRSLLQSEVPDSLLETRGTATNTDLLSGQDGASPSPLPTPEHDVAPALDQSAQQDEEARATQFAEATASCQATSPAQTMAAQQTTVSILQRPAAQPSPGGPGSVVTTPAADVLAPLRAAPNRYASPPITMRRTRARGAATPAPWTLGDFLTAATKHLDAALPAPGKKTRRRPLNFTPRRGRSASTTTAAPPTAERRARVQLLRTLGIVDVDQHITPEMMKAFDNVFAAPIPLAVLSAIAALVDRQIPASMPTTPVTPTAVAATRGV